MLHRFTHRFFLSGPEGASPGGGSNASDGNATGAGAGDGAERLYTGDEVEAIVANRMRRAATPPPTPPARGRAAADAAQPASTSSDPSAMIGDLVKLHMVQALAALQPPATPTRRGPPVSDGGSPQRDPGLATEGQVWRMTDAEVKSLIREKGMAAAGKELKQKLRHDLQHVRLYLGRGGSR